MPYYRGPRVRHQQESDNTTIDAAAASLLTTIITQDRDYTTCLANYPVRFGQFPSPTPPGDRQMYNSEFPALAYRVARFSWAIYSFNSGHFSSTILTQNLPFAVTLACDPYAYRRALFTEFTGCRCILLSAAALLDHIRGSGKPGLIDGYLIHSHRYQTSEPTHAFWSI
jgi:hypothetical protein